MVVSVRHFRFFGQVGRLLLALVTVVLVYHILRNELFAPFTIDVAVTFLWLSFLLNLVWVASVPRKMLLFLGYLVASGIFSIWWGWTLVFTFFVLTLVLLVLLIASDTILAIFKSYIFPFIKRAVVTTCQRVKALPVTRSLLAMVGHDIDQIAQYSDQVYERTQTFFFNPAKVPAKKFYIVTVAMFLIFAVAIYYPLYASYFIQDEWYYFGLFNQFVEKPSGFIDIFIQQFSQPRLYGIHFTPLWNTLFFLQYQLFGLQYQWYGIGSILLHTITATAVVWFWLGLTKSRLISFLAGLFFAVTFAHTEAVYWANTHIQTQGATLLAIGAMSTWITGLTQQKRSLLFVSLILTFIGLLLKETVFAVFVVLFISTVLYGKRRQIMPGLKLVIISVLVYLPFRVLLAKFLTMRDQSLTTAPVIPGGIFDIFPQTYRLITYPFKAMIQELIPVDTVTRLAEEITGWSYPTYAAGRAVRGSTFLTFVQSAGSDMVMIYLGIILAVVFLLLYKMITNRYPELRKPFVLAVGIVVASIIPLLFIANWLQSLFAFVTFLDSRHLYFTSIGSSFLFALLPLGIAAGVDYFCRFFKRRRRVVARLPLGAAVLFTILFTCYLSYNNRLTIQKSAAIGQERKAIIETITKTYPTIGDTAIFYIKSNKPYYGFGELIPPFQTNFGQTLLVQYHKRKQYDPGFFTSGFLLEKGIPGEDYRVIDGKGFGYFISEKSLTRFVIENNFPVYTIYAFSYDGMSMTTTDITASTREKLQKLFTDAQAFAQWQRYEAAKVRFRYPPNTTIVEDTEFEDSRIRQRILVITPSGDAAVTITIYNKPDTIGVRGYLATLSNITEQALIDAPDANVTVGNFDTWPAVLFETDEEKTYYFNTVTNTELKQITFYKQQSVPELDEPTFLHLLEFLN